MANAFTMGMTIPGYADQQTPDAHTVQVSASANVGVAQAQATLKVAWIIIIVGLVLLWLLGYTFR